MLNRDEWRGDYVAEDSCLPVGRHAASGLSAGPRHIPTIHHLITIYADLRRPNTSMSLQKISSKLKKKWKRRFAGGRREPERPEAMGAEIGEGRAGSTISLPQPSHHAAVEGEYGRPKSWNEASVDGGQVDSTDQTPFRHSTNLFQTS